ncbi:hypothetical protein [Moraxella oblonga]|uniref:hypothetical protein n=1 Tax=Moraxella oblonga TaxID=200413 RepID=UPI0008359ABE|nr:hypothetical protein [Moraxella oblonga]
MNKFKCLPLCISIFLISGIASAKITGFRHTPYNPASSAEFIGNDTLRGGSGVQANIDKNGNIAFSNGTYGAVMAYIHDEKGNVIKEIIIPPANQDKFKSMYDAIVKKSIPNLGSLATGKTIYSEIQWYDSPDFKISTEIKASDFPKGGGISFANGTPQTIMATVLSAHLKGYSTLASAVIKTNNNSSFASFLAQEILSEAVTDISLINEISFLIQNGRSKDIGLAVTNWLKLNGHNIVLTAIQRHIKDDTTLQTELVDKVTDVLKPLELTSDALTTADQFIELVEQAATGPKILYFSLPYEGDYFTNDFYYFNWSNTALSNQPDMRWTPQRNQHDDNYDKVRWYNPLSWGYVSDGFQAEYARWSLDKHPDRIPKSQTCNDNPRPMICKINNDNILTNTWRYTQNGTSHFGVANNTWWLNKPADKNQNARQTIQENPYLAKGSMTLEAPADIVLRWGNHPADLDSHLTGPVRANSSERFHIHFENKGSLTGNPNAMLYRDDTSHGAGSTNRPEQTRINVTQPGVYNFYVHDFSNKGSQNSKALSQSGATVTLYSAGNRNLPEGNNLGKQVGRPIPVPKDKVGTVWHSFELDTRRNTLTPKDTMSNDRNIIK